MAVLPEYNNEKIVVRVFVDIDAEFLSLIDHNYKPKESKKKDRQGKNQEFLH